MIKPSNSRSQVCAWHDERRGHGYHLTGQKLSHIILFSLDKSSLHIFPLDKRGGEVVQYSRDCAKVRMAWGKEGVIQNTPENVRMGWGKEGVIQNTPENVRMEWGKEGVIHNTPENVRMEWGKEGVIQNTSDNVHMLSLIHISEPTRQS